jgi:hypothetical protein
MTENDRIEKKNTGKEPGQKRTPEKCRWLHVCDGIMVLPYCGHTGLTIKRDLCDGGACAWFEL